MRVKIFDDHESLSAEAASQILAQVQKKPDSTLCLAAGDTPRRAYELLGHIAVESKIDWSKCSFIGLDEWIGVPPSNEGSCAFFLTKNLFSRLSVDRSRIHLFDALAPDPLAECNKMDTLIRKAGGIDLMLVGVGMNGHVGFNEPGVSRNLYSHVSALDQTTQTVGRKYFNETTALYTGITLGFRHLMECRQVIMMASGLRKAKIIREVVEGPITTDVPASLVREHGRAEALLDRDAASLLSSTLPG